MYARATIKGLSIAGGFCAVAYGYLHINNGKEHEYLFLGLIVLGAYLILDGFLGPYIKKG